MVPAMPKTPNPFGELDNKDLAGDPDIETKTGDDVADDDEEADVADDQTPAEPVEPSAEASTEEKPAGETVSVEMIHHETCPGTDKNLIPGDVVELPKDFADKLIASKRARKV